MDKEQIRNNIKARKSLLSAIEKAKAAMAVFSSLEQSAAFALADTAGNISFSHASTV